MRRELRSVATEAVVGAVDDRLAEPFEGAAATSLAGLRREVGDARALELVMVEGWSNAYLYFAAPVDSENR